MTDLRTRYLGIELKNPIVVGASNLVTDLDIAKKMEEAGAAAIVYKSLFEEQIQLESFEMDEELNAYNDVHAEMTSLFPDLQHAGPEEHLMKVEKLSNSIDIPLIASLNAVFEPTWVEYALQLEKLGVAALELNFFAVPKDVNKDGHSIIEEQIKVLNKVRAKVKIPISVKLSPYYTNQLRTITAMDKEGVDGFVLFNRLFQPDIDIEKEEMFFPYNLSSHEDNRLALRFAGLLYGNLNGSICSANGILDGKDVIKMILAGADCVQVVSTLYKNKSGHIKVMLEDIENWMEKKGYKTLEEFRGKLSNKNIDDPYAYKRAQYVDILMKSDNIFRAYPKG
ncbi:MAG: dihydroorotate dehydrogenase-like protein [Bacteroidales bacterium]|nr:dihydroorotate dehydrogenase-like protein [Bacteroidales bacterium]